MWDKAFYIAYGWNIVVSLFIFVLACLRNFEFNAYLDDAFDNECEVHTVN